MLTDNEHYLSDTLVSDYIRKAEEVVFKPCFYYNRCGETIVFLLDNQPRYACDINAYFTEYHNMETGDISGFVIRSAKLLLPEIDELNETALHGRLLSLYEKILLEKRGYKAKIGEEIHDVPPKSRRLNRQGCRTKISSKHKQALHTAMSYYLMAGAKLKQE